MVRTPDDSRSSLPFARAHDEGVPNRDDRQENKPPRNLAGRSQDAEDRSPVAKEAGQRDGHDPAPVE